MKKGHSGSYAATMGLCKLSGPANTINYFWKHRAVISTDGNSGKELFLLNFSGIIENLMNRVTRTKLYSYISCEPKIVPFFVIRDVSFEFTYCQLFHYHRSQVFLLNSQPIWFTISLNHYSIIRLISKPL